MLFILLPGKLLVWINQVRAVSDVDPLIAGHAQQT